MRLGLESRLDILAEVLAEVAGVSTVLKNASGRARSLEGLDDVNAVLMGAAPEAPVPVSNERCDLYGGSDGRAENRPVL